MSSADCIALVKVYVEPLRSDAKDDETPANEADIEVLRDAVEVLTKSVVAALPPVIVIEPFISRLPVEESQASLLPAEPVKKKSP